MTRRLILMTLLLCSSQLLFGQLYPERREVRRGNRAYERENYVEAESRYTGALSKNPAFPEGIFNLGNTYFRQGRFEEAEQRFGALGQTPAPPEQGSQAFYNQGNAQVRQYQSSYNREKLTQALEAYKQSLRLNPDDTEAKFNLAYVQKLLEDENGGGGDDNNDQNPDQDPNQNPDQNSGENEGNPDPNEGENDPREGENGEQPQSRGGISPQEAEQMLDAIQNGEESAREKMEGEPAAAVGRSGKNW